MCDINSLFYSNFSVYQGARIDIRNKLGHTALHIALFEEKVRVCHVLLELGADIYVASEEGTSQHIALQSNNEDIKNLFQNYTKSQGNFRRLDRLRKQKKIMNYRLGNRLGNSAFGVVYKGFNLSAGQLVAVKLVNRRIIPKMDLNRIEIECNALRRIDHPNIVKLVDFGELEYEIALITEYMGDRSLRGILDIFGTFPENILVFYIRDVLDALEYLHTNNIVHRDIKSANLFVTGDRRCKIADFESCCIDNNNMFLSRVGSLHWMSPQMIEGKATASGLSDIWSLGITIIELLFGNPPLYELDKDRLSTAIIESSIPSWPIVNVSDELNDFLAGTFVYVEAIRPPASKLRKHPWILGESAQSYKILPYEHLHAIRTKKAFYLNGLSLQNRLSNLPEPVNSFFESLDLTSPISFKDFADSKPSSESKLEGKRAGPLKWQHGELHLDKMMQESLLEDSKHSSYASDISPSHSMQFLKEPYDSFGNLRLLQVHKLSKRKHFRSNTLIDFLMGSHNDNFRDSNFVPEKNILKMPHSRTILSSLTIKNN